jgi:hypothetical protein
MSDGTKITGVRWTRENEVYRWNPEIQREVNARHAAQCGCENWVGCCLLRPGFLEQAVRDVENEQAGKGA